MNIFEGSRRVAKAIALLWVAGFLIAAALNKEVVYETYFVLGLNQDPILLLSKKCSEDSANEFGLPTFTTPKGSLFNPRLCFEAHGGFENGRRLVPYMQVPNSDKVYGDERFSSGVKAYTSAYAKNFQVPSKDYEKIDALAKTKWWSTIGSGAILMFAGLFFLYLLTFGFGWIVRGFLSIPRGKDGKE